MSLKGPSERITYIESTDQDHIIKQWPCCINHRCATEFARPIVVN